MSKEAPIKVLLAKPGLDGHDRGVKVIALALRDAGMEVIYTGLHQTVEQIVRIAIQESAEVIGLSMLSGSHIPISQRLMNRLKEEELAEEVLVVVGGNIPNKDSGTLKSLGVDCIFPTDTSFEDIVDGIRAKARKK